MSVAEMKLKVHSLIEKQDDVTKLEQVLEMLTNTEKREWTAQKIFNRMATRYDNTLRKLAQ